MVTVDPVVWENVDARKARAGQGGGRPGPRPTSGRSLISIPDWTTYTKDQIIACKGPGE